MKTEYYLIYTINSEDIIWMYMNENLKKKYKLMQSRLPNNDFYLSKNIK